MCKPHTLTRWLLVCGLALSACTTAAWAQTETLRNEVLRPLQAAQELNRQNKAAQALQQFAEIDALPPGNPLEVFTTERLRAVVLLAAGQNAAAAKALDKALQTERGSVPERLALMEHLVQLQYNAKAYAEAALWAGRYLALGGQREQLRTLQAQALYLSGQYPSAAEVLQQNLQRDLDARRTPDELMLRMLANSQQQLKNEAGYVRALELLVRHHPKSELWADLVARQMRQHNLPPHLEIDAYRLLRQVGAGHSAGEAIEHAQLAIAAGYPAEARQALESAQAAEEPEEKRKLQTLLAEARRLQQEDERQLAQTETLLAKARDGNPWVNMGLNLALNGQAPRGVALMRQGLDKGGLRQPAAARLRLGYAQLLAGEREAARTSFEALGSESAPEAVLARLWLLHLDAKR